MDNVNFSEKNILANVRSFFKDMAPILATNPNVIIDYVEKHLRAIEKQWHQCSYFTVVVTDKGFKIEYSIPNVSLSAQGNFVVSEKILVDGDTARKQRLKYANKEEGFLGRASKEALKCFLMGRSVMWRMHASTRPVVTDETTDIEFTPTPSEADDRRMAYNPSYSLDRL